MSLSVFTALLLALVLPVALYVREGWRIPEASTASAIGFYTAGRSLSIPEYAATTVAYGLQMAAVVLFAQWGYYYGYASLIVPFAWFVGFVLLAACAKRLDQFLQSSGTLHGYIGERHGNSSLVVRTAALATVLGLGGALFAELRWVADLVQHLLGQTEAFRYSLMLLFLVAVLTYVLPTGYRAVVSTDVLQLPLGYVGLTTLLSATIYTGLRLGRPVGGAFLVGFLSVLAIFLVSVWGLRRSDSASRVPLRSLLVAGTCLILITASYLTGAFGTRTSAGTGLSWDPQPMPILTLISLLVANGLWQLVDLSAFQRLSSLKLPETADQRIATLRRAILWTSLESPISWCVGIAIGVGLGQLGTFGGPDGAWTAYEVFLSNLALNRDVGIVIPEIGRALVVGLTVAGLVAIMLSTVDSIGSAVSFTSIADFVGGGKEARVFSVWRARWVTLASLALVAVVYGFWEIRISGQHDIGSWLYIAYAMQLSLFAVAGAAILGLRLAWWVAFASVSAGIVASVWLGARLAVAGDPNAFVVPPLAAVAAALGAALFLGAVRVGIVRSRAR